jgi:hypothetical protein
MLVLSVALAMRVPLHGVLAGYSRQELSPSPPISLSWREGFLCVPVSLMGGRPTWFLLDTGSYRSFLTKRAFNRLQAAGAKVLEDGSLTIKSVSVGGYSVPPINFAPEAEQFEFTVDGAADGYLGMDFFSKYKVGLDIGQKVLRLWPAGADTNVARKEFFAGQTFGSAWSAPILDRPEGYCVAVDVGNLTVPMVLDTGCPDTMIHSDLASKLIGAKRGKASAANFYNGLHNVRSYSVPFMAIGGVPLDEKSVSVAGVARLVGLLGRDLLAPLKVLIDYPGSKVHFIKTRADLLGPSPVEYDGPQVTLQSGVVVRYPRGVVAHVPAFCLYTLPPGYREVFKNDETVDLVPTKGATKGLLMRSL